MVSQILVPKRLGFRSTAAQDLVFTAIPVADPCCMKRMIAIRRSKGGKRTKEICVRCKELVCQQLLPGIPDEITLDLVIPKLSWRGFLALSSVRRCWEDAIRTNHVYEARVRANATETLIMHVHVHDEGIAIALYSTSEQRCYELPQIPWLPRRMPKFCEGVALGGKIYVVGGPRNLEREPVLEAKLVRDQQLVDGDVSRGEVYLLDLAGGQGKWEQCASMPAQQSDFACGIIDGKIYAFVTPKDSFTASLRQFGRASGSSAQVCQRQKLTLCEAL